MVGRETSTGFVERRSVSQVRAYRTLTVVQRATSHATHRGAGPRLASTNRFAADRCNTHLAKGGFGEHQR